MDFSAPEYALDEILVTASDMYSLGCLIYAVHCKGQPPFKTHDSLGGLRETAGRALINIERLDGDLQGISMSIISDLPINLTTSTPPIANHTLEQSSYPYNAPLAPIFFFYSHIDT
jgi:SCY1-like protein 2